MAFMDTNFLLKTETARKLFFEHANKMPIFDFHCHLNPQAIYENNKFKNITEAWLAGDHYKWRLMRAIGVDENLITGNGDDYEKFLAFTRALQYSIGNPVYHWAHLELAAYFGIKEPLTEKTARSIYDRANEMLQRDDFRVRDFIKKSNVVAVFTTDDPIDSLEYHKKIAEDKSFTTKVLPAFRPDKAININLDTFAAYIQDLGKAANISIKSFKDIKDALSSRIKFFDSFGCKASDHGITYIPYAEATEKELDDILAKAMNSQALTNTEIDQYKTALLQFLASEYTKLNWVMEIHFGVLRNNNTTMFKKLGPDTGYDAAGDYTIGENLAYLLNSMNEKGGLPRTILFPINPKDHHVVSTIMGCFQSNDTASKMQSGTAWWFNDHINGMNAQMKALADVGVLGKFLGMLTDSRSFLSYPRHEYFRRILCNLVGELIENGEYYAEPEVIGQIIEDICYNNAAKYFSQI